MDDLKPCPFCGRKIEGVSVTICPGMEEHPSHQIECYTCGAMSGYKVTTAEAIAAWNTRPTPAGDAAGLVESQECVSDAVHKALWDADTTIAAQAAELQRLREALQRGVEAVDTGRNEPLMIWRDHARNLTGAS